MMMMILFVILCSPCETITGIPRMCCLSFVLSCSNCYDDDDDDDDDNDGDDDDDGNNDDVGHGHDNGKMKSRCEQTINCIMSTLFSN